MCSEGKNEALLGGIGRPDDKWGGGGGEAGKASCEMEVEVNPKRVFGRACKPPAMSPWDDAIVGCRAPCDAERLPVVGTRGKY